jgi:hypothetical protein
MAATQYIDAALILAVVVVFADVASTAYRFAAKGQVSQKAMVRHALLTSMAYTALLLRILIAVI